MFDFSLLPPMLLHTVFVSIPEELFMVAFTLILMKRYDLLALNRSNILKLVTTAAPFALLSNILRGFADFNMNYTSLICFTGIFLLGIIVYGVRKPKDMLMVFLGLALSLVVVMAIQASYLVFILYGTSITVESLNQYSLQTFLVSLADRVVQIALIGLMLLKKQKFMKLNYFKIIGKNRNLAILSTFVIVMNILFVYLMCNLIYFQKILMPFESGMQLAVVLAVIIFPVVNISAVLGIINFSLNKISYTKVYIQEESKVLRVLVQMLLKQKRYEDIDYELYSFENEVKRLD